MKISGRIQTVVERYCRQSVERNRECIYHDLESGNPFRCTRCDASRDAVRVDHVYHSYLTLSPRRQLSPSPLLKRVSQPKTMPRARSPQSESDSEPVSSKKQKKREESPADDPMDEDGGEEVEEEVEYEIEVILDSSERIFEDVCSICWSWLRESDLNVPTG